MQAGGGGLQLCAGDEDVPNAMLEQCESHCCPFRHRVALWEHHRILSSRQEQQDKFSLPYITQCYNLRLHIKESWSFLQDFGHRNVPWEKQGRMLVNECRMGHSRPGIH